MVMRVHVDAAMLRDIPEAYGWDWCDEELTESELFDLAVIESKGGWDDECRK